jgi:hypothetical protein
MAQRSVVAREGRRRAVALVVMAAALTGCGDPEDAGDAGDAGDASSADTGSKTVLIKTHMKLFDGEVLDDSRIGTAAFCPGGTVRHEHGSPDIGFPAVNVFDCPTGRLEIGFGPGPDQMDNAVQTSDWKVLDGSGDFAGVTGTGTMEVRFPVAGSDEGDETFRGTLLSP